MVQNITISTTPVVTLELMKRQLVIDQSFTEDDSYITFLIHSQTNLVENYIMQHIREKQIKVRLSVAGTESRRLPWPVKTFDKLETNTGTAIAEVDRTFLEIDKFDCPHRVGPSGLNTWPEVNKGYYYLTLTVGMDVVPEDIQDAIMILVTDKYENRIEQVRQKRTNVYEMIEHHRYKEFYYQICDYSTRLKYVGTMTDTNTPTTNKVIRPKFYSIVDAMDPLKGNLSIGDEFVYEEGNYDGYMGGTIVEILPEMI